MDMNAGLGEQAVAGKMILMGVAVENRIHGRRRPSAIHDIEGGVDDHAFPASVNEQAIARWIFPVVVSAQNTDVFAEPELLVAPFRVHALRLLALFMRGLSGTGAILRDEGTQPGIKPLMFKNLIGKGDPEFSSNRQQDAQEFMMFLLTHLERAHRNHEVASTGNIFKFNVEDRMECGGQVRYKTRQEFFLPFNIPLEAATNLADVEEYKKKKI